MIWSILLASLGAGWVGAAALAGTARDRALWTAPLGGGLSLACALLLSLVLPPTVATTSCAAGALLVAFLLRRGRRPWKPLQLGWSFWLLWPLSALVGWLNLVGGLQLRPSRSWLLFDLPRLAQLSSGGSGGHPLGPEAALASSPFCRLAFAGSDPLASSLLLGGGAQLLAVLCWMLLLARCNRRAPLAVALGALAWFLGSSRGWLLVESPGPAVGHLLLVVSVTLAWCRGPGWSLFPLAGLAVLDPLLAAGALLGFLVRLPRWVPVLFLLVALSLGLGGGGVPLLAAAYLWWFHPKRWLRNLALLEFFCPGGFGLAALGLAVGRALTARWRRYSGESFGLAWRPVLSLRIPRRFLVGLLALVSLWFSMAEGEGEFNDRILIFSQKRKVSLEELLTLRSLPRWAGWRGAAFGLEPADLKAAERLRQLREPVLYLTGEREESPEVAALLSALAGGHPLAGWSVGKDGCALLPAAAAVSAGGTETLLSATPVRWLMRRGEPARPIPALAQRPLVGGAEPLRMERWGQLMWYRSEGPASYTVTRDGKPFGPEFSVQSVAAGEIPFVLPRELPGLYRVVWSDGAEQGYRSDRPLPLEATLIRSDAVPSRSLLPLRLRLLNRSPFALDLDELQGGRVRLLSQTGKLERPFPTFPLAPLAVGPGKAVEMTVYLRTPIAPDISQPELQLLDVSGGVHTLPLAGPIRTWNRRPSLVVPEGVVRR